SLRDTGRELFHAGTRSGIACASCHPEGGDDGRVWNFETPGKRRTQPLQGGLKGSEPFHWSGDLPSFGSLMDAGFVQRMGGPQPTDEQSTAVLDWLDTLPALPAARVDAEAFERGRLLFVSDDLGCASCHDGPRYASNQSVDVGT